MAIFGIGSMWVDEKKEDFFRDKNFVVGWDYFNAPDIYEAVSLLKAGDIIYLKANRPGSRTNRVKTIGFVTHSFIHHFIADKLQSTDISDWNNFSIPVEWIVKEEFYIEIPLNEGRLTNIRAATFYEEFLPFVQQQILKKLFGIKFINEKSYFMD